MVEVYGDHAGVIRSHLKESVGKASDISASKTKKEGVWDLRITLNPKCHNRFPEARCFDETSL